ncbi:homeobox protein 5-like [Teleopsis dalmanni]|uniref:homeobox protein 5-like n=1 Tax=Teleopsis dalmanni TaxID=139649 RepID=UPI0018CE8AE4|nr:homeobox protein 5-like [Teleopsis dalmanni]
MLVITNQSHLGIDNFLLNNDNGQQYSYYDTQDNFNSNTNNNHNNNNNNNNENAIRSKNNNDMITGNVLKMNSTESGTHSPLSIDNIDEINQSAELQCLLQEHIETSTFGNTSDFCFTQFDTILCWPRTPRGTLAVLPCLDELQGIQYDSSRKYTSKNFSKDGSPRPESTRPLTSYYGKGKRESCVSSATTTTIIGHNPPMTLQRGSNGALHMLPTATTLTVMPRAISPLMRGGLEENSV